MRKNLLLTVFILFTAIPSLAQHFKHGVGTSLYFYQDNVFKDQVGFAINYSPVYFFAEAKKTSFSVGMPVTFGLSNGMFGYISNYEDGRTVESTTKFMLNIPVIFNFNFGGGAVKNGTMKHGFFIGGGPGVNVSPISYFQYGGTVDDYVAENGDHSRAVVGANYNFGWRVAPGEHRSYFELKINGFKGVTGKKPDVAMITCMWNF